MVEYLRKFPNLQALTVHENPFCKEESSQSVTDPSKNFQYPGSYEIILAILEKLKYLDYRPIDPVLRKNAFDHYKTQNQKGERGDAQYKIDEEKEKAQIKMEADLKHACADAVLTFYHLIDERISSETNKEKLKKLPGYDDKMKMLEKFIEEHLNSFKKEILLCQEQKDQIIVNYEKKFEFGREKYVEQSKNLIYDFKRKFKKYCLNIPPNVNIEEFEKEIGLPLLKEKLYEIEAHLKSSMSILFQTYIKEINDWNNFVVTKTDNLRNDLVSNKDTLKKNLSSIRDEVQAKIDEMVDPSDSMTEVNILFRKYKYNKNLYNLYKIL